MVVNQLEKGNRRLVCAECGLTGPLCGPSAGRYQRESGFRDSSGGGERSDATAFFAKDLRDLQPGLIHQIVDLFAVPMGLG